jgi:hypothetical protein
MNKLASLIALGALFSAGCSAEVGEAAEVADLDDTGSVEQAFTEAACPTQTPDAFLTTIGTNQYKEVFGSPPYGNANCTLAFKVDLLAGQASGFNAYAFWDSPKPTTQAACLAASVRSRLYEKVGANWILRQSALSAQSWSNNQCINLFTGHGPITNTPNRWMFITQARNSTGALQKLRIGMFAF